MKLLCDCLRRSMLLLMLLLLVAPAFAENPAAEAPPIKKHAVSSTAENPAAEAPPPTKKYAEFTLRGTYTDTKGVSPFSTSSTKTLRGLLNKLEMLKADEALAGVIFKIEGVSLGWATLQEIRAKLGEFRAAGKETIGYLEGGGNAEYLLASATDHIALMPTGILNLTGLRAEILFYKGLLDKLDIEAEMLAMGKYKSGVEPYTREHLSDASREAMSALIDDLYSQLLNHIAESRDGITPESAATLVDRGPFTAKEALQAKLVDTLHYYDALLTEIKAAAGDEALEIVKPESDGKRKVLDMNSFGGLMQLFSLLNPPQRARPAAKDNQIALIYANGPILPDKVDSIFATLSTITPRKLKRALQKARDTNTVRAVVLRVDSPGGSAIASDLIWREVMLTQAEKPVVVSMGNIAASGGYYIAMAAGTIVAHPSTLTGSIGVFGGKLNMKGLYNKAGLTKEIIAHGQNATLYSDYGGFTATERERVETLMKNVYDDFVTKAAAGRNRSFEDINAIAQGRIWTGKQAKEIGLVDQLGGLDTALAIAKKQAGFTETDKINLLILPKPQPFFEKMIEQLIENSEISTQPPLHHAILPILADQWHHIAIALTLFGPESSTHVATFLPYEILIR